MKKTKKADPAPSKKLVLERETLRRHVTAGTTPSTGGNCSETITHDTIYSE